MFSLIHYYIFKSLDKGATVQETGVLKKGSNQRAVCCPQFPTKSAEIWWNSALQRRTFGTRGISAVMSRGHNANCFNLALLAHIHPCMLQNPRPSNSASANSLTFFHLLTTHLHNPMLHSPIPSASPTGPLIYQTASPVSVLGAE